MKKLGFGLMRLPLLDQNDAGSIDIEETKRMVDTFLEKGFTYFDTAWMYCAFKSEEATKTALVERHPRDSFTLADKLHAGFIETKEDRDRIFNEQLRKTGAEYFDYYLLHDVGTDHYKKYTELDCFTWLKDKKEKGLVKHIGFSFHDNADLLERVLSEHPEVEFVQLQLNYLDWESEGVQSRKCYETAVRHHVPVFVMEPVKGGTLANVPDEVEEALRESVYTIIHAVKGILEQTPPELSADIIDKGIVLTGGGALVDGFAQILSQELKVPVFIAESPLTCVAEGTGILLDNLYMLERQ